jgi:hypothetical protein
MGQLSAVVAHFAMHVVPQRVELFDIENKSHKVILWLFRDGQKGGMWVVKEMFVSCAD